MSDKEEQDGPKLDVNKSPVSARRAKKLLILSEYLSKQESRNTTKKVSRILQKADTDITEEERETLGKNQDIVKRIHKNKERRRLSEQRTQETEDTEEELKAKCEELAKAILVSRKTVIYTGAGISTAASIPDYRGPQGVWTLLQRGEELKPQDLSDAEPTTTHMCIAELYKQGHVTHVVSQNCDGLHLRSGFPRRALSEVHGNMYIEICYNCKPHREYIRLFDVTESTGVRRHYTGRHCHQCNGELSDTIVHFGEKGRLKSPYRWKEAAKAANKCDLILCLGTSLKILKKYACLWCMDRTRQKRPKLIIVNLQWTPKDEAASLKINGKCDDVMVRVLKNLGITPQPYKRELDPILMLASVLQASEAESMNKKSLVMPECIVQQRSAATISPVVCSDTSSDSDSDETSSESSSESTESDDEVEVQSNHMYYEYYQGSDRNSVKNRGENVESDEEKMVMLKTKCLAKSLQICNNAMQKKINEKWNRPSFAEDHISHARNQVNAINLYHNSVSGTSNIPMQGSQNHLSPKRVCQEEHSYSRPKTVKERRVGSPSQFFNGLSYEERLLQLQVLQTQLKELKEKQKEIQEQELLKDQHVKPECVSSEILKHEHPQSFHPTVADSAKVEQANAMINYEIERLEMHRKTYQETQLREFKQRIEREKQEMKQQHGNEHLRLSQHYIIQQQMIEQTGLGAQRQAENLRWFEEQQQLLLTRQTCQLQELLARHQTLERDLREYLNNFSLKMGEKINELKATLIQRQTSVVVSPTSRWKLSPGNAGMVSQTAVATFSGPISPKCVNSASGMTGLNVNVKCGLEAKGVPGMKSPTQTDFSIAAIMSPPKKTEPQVTIPAPSAIPGFQELVSTLTMCDLCKSLNAYQRVNHSCPRCEELKKMKHGHTLANINITGKSELTDSPHVPNAQNHQTYAYNHPHGNFDKHSQHHETLTYTNVKGRIGTGDGIVHSNQTYLQDQSHPKEASLLKDRNKLNRQSLSVDMNTPSSSSSSLSHRKEILKTPTTSDSISNVSSELELSPVIPYASGNARKMQGTTPVITKRITKRDTCNQSTDGTKIIQISPNMQKVSDNTEMIPANNIEISRAENGVVKAGTSNLSHSVKDGNKEVTEHVLCKPVRSHSQSELYDQKSAEVSCEKRTVRSRSQSEISTCDNVVQLKTEESASGEASPAEDTCSSSKTQKKRKLSRAVSVPGWFGKGLNLKRKKRY